MNSTNRGQVRQPTQVAVLMGGTSAERQISLKSGQRCAAALQREGYDVIPMDADTHIAAKLQETRPDIVFNALHGGWGENGSIQGALEILGIPYTHSGITPSAIAMNKHISKRLFQAAGIPTPPHKLTTRQQAAKTHLMKPPYAVKPLDQGSSLGVILVTDKDAPPPAKLLEPEWKFGDNIILEQFIPGRELTCGIMDNQPMEVIDIVTDTAFYDYRNKYTPGAARHILPAHIPPDIQQRIQEISLQAHRILGCRGISRADLRWDDTIPGTQGLFLLEINTQPGMTETSLIPHMAEHAGIPYDQLVRWMVEDASCPR